MRARVGTDLSPRQEGGSMLNVPEQPQPEPTSDQSLGGLSNRLSMDTKFQKFNGMKRREEENDAEKTDVNLRPHWANPGARCFGMSH